MLKKEEVFVRVSSEKKARKLAKLLEMFGEKVFDEDVVDEALQNGWDVEFYHNKWVSSNDTSSKTKVSLKELRNILTVENESTKKELEVGKWYKFMSCNEEYLLNYNVTDVAYGFYNGSWDEEWRFSKYGNQKLAIGKEATPQEVEEALIKEAKKRGVIQGVTVLDKYGNTFKNINGTYVYRDNKLAYGGCIIFQNGKWAEVVNKSVDKCTEAVKISVDKFAELKEACRSGKTIQVLIDTGWKDWDFPYEPSFDADISEYRIKPEKSLEERVKELEQKVKELESR